MDAIKEAMIRHEDTTGHSIGHMEELASWRDAKNIRQDCRYICGWAYNEIERLQKVIGQMAADKINK